MQFVCLCVMVIVHACVRRRRERERELKAAQAEAWQALLAACTEDELDALEHVGIEVVPRG